MCMGTAHAWNGPTPQVLCGLSSQDVPTSYAFKLVTATLSVHCRCCGLALRMCPPRTPTSLKPLPSCSQAKSSRWWSRHVARGYPWLHELSDSLSQRYWIHRQLEDAHKSFGRNPLLEDTLCCSQTGNGTCTSPWEVCL